jgi:aminopeptidase-like protein
MAEASSSLMATVQKQMTNSPEARQPDGEGAELFAMVSALYPICRSITGNGVRQSLRQLQGHIGLSLHEVPTGTRVFDWAVPKEWNIRDAYIKDSRGLRVVDFQKNSLHVLNYSLPVQEKMQLSELRKHLFTLPETPDWIPYRTTYYKENWGFCLAQRQLDTLADGEYEVCIDSSLEPGSLTYGEFRIQGATDDEVLVSCHSCHPSLCNDNLSGMTVATKLAQRLSTMQLRYSYRFLWLPGTIGAITWLALNESIRPLIKHGLVLSCIGDPGRFNYKRSRHGNAEIDRVVEHVLRHTEDDFVISDFSPYGYDERQYCSPGINLPVGCFMRTPNGKYPQYHTSADDLNLVKPEALAGSLHRLLRIVQTLEANCVYENLNPKCEPQLGRRGLYRNMGGTSGSRFEESLLWVLNFSDGAHSLLDIAERSGLDFNELDQAAKALLKTDLLRLVR